ncbi:hypothetical protein Daus18300_010803 [Diaporthe australafricana]|uniref:Uncharacterized protein n=1 Tax=Diaporthe australafricana TaxID=127596 RepID=A0ABR3W901_9PEZI
MSDSNYRGDTGFSLILLTFSIDATSADACKSQKAIFIHQFNVEDPPPLTCTYTLDHQTIGDIGMLADLLPLTTLGNIPRYLATIACASATSRRQSGTRRIQHLKLLLLTTLRNMHSAMVASICLGQLMGGRGPGSHPQFMSQLTSPRAVPPHSESMEDGQEDHGQEDDDEGEDGE